MRRVGQEDCEDTHGATSLVEEESIGDHCCSESEERACSETVEHLFPTHELFEIVI